MKTATFRKNQIVGQSQGTTPKTGPAQPPKKRITATAEIVTMWTYSARKNSANFTPEYSVWYPATSSVSASGRSKGARFVSAIPETRKTAKAGSWTRMNQVSCCASTMPRRDRVPA